MFPFLTQNDAQQRLRDDGLLALGLTAVIIGRRWSTADIAVDNAAMSFTTTTPVLAPFVGIRRQLDEIATVGLFDVSGTPVAGVGTRFDLHPQAAARLETLVNARLGVAAGSIRPVPVTLLVRATDPAPETDQWFSPEEAIAPAGTCSFHDSAGQIVCPIAAAALFEELATSMQALAPGGWSISPPAGVPGEVAHVARKATGVVVAVTDPHGAPWAAPGAETIVVAGAGGATSPVPANGIVVLAATETVTASVAAPTDIRFSWCRNSTLGTTALTPPPLAAGVTLTRQFLRVIAVDLSFHILGNRTSSPVLGVPADDQRLLAPFQPVVRDAVNVDFLVDGVDVIGAAGGIVTAFVGGGGGPGLFFAASPVFEASVGLPPSPGQLSPNPLAHWPTFPPPPPAGAAGTGLTAAALTASWSGDRDVTVAIAGGVVTPGSSVRLYPQVFEVVASIGPEPSFLRGDGATVVVPDANPISMLLVNPLRLGDGDIRPAGAVLTVDAAITPINGPRRITGNLAVPIGSVFTPAVVDQFAANAVLDSLPASMRGIAPSPVFGIVGPPPAPGGGGASLGDLLRSLAGETSPRSAPRLPTMARFPTIVAVGIGPTTAPMAWSAVVTGGHIARETRSSLQDQGNPGNPAGPDVSAPGVRVDGALGFDAAAIALRRAQPIIPFDADGVDGWIPFVANTGWVPPVAGSAPAPATCAGAVLRTVAVGVETPELLPAAIPAPPPGATAQTVINSLAGLVGVPAPTFTVVNDVQIIQEIRREFAVTRNGQRDALWALRRAVGSARRLVFVASPQFCATARPDGAPAAHELDLVAVLADRMASQRSLRVVIAVPRLPDHAKSYGGWVREALQARAEAVDALRGVDAKRVAVFHPVGFPGRHLRIRTTSVIVDDTWALVGTSHWRRRGMTFDEGVDVVSIDRTLDATGASSRIRAYRRGLMAQMLQIATPAPASAPSADWVRLGSPLACHDLVADLIDQGGLGRLLAFWPGPTDTDVIAMNHDVADPDGASEAGYLTLFAGLIGESPA